MMPIETKVKRWGNSLGIIIPSETIATRKIKENQSISFIILEDSKKVLEETFGSLRNKLKRSSQKIKDELRRELY
jgi:antitoxin component of MazEF toxin-antitoxin module